MKPQTRNELTLDSDGVWGLPIRQEFAYSEGAEIERYLERALRASTDLSTTSAELEGWIRDWPSLYHLSRSRSNLLRPFEFDKKARVLEVGCGCGAISRFLGETFESVVSVEGSWSRARLARLRTRDLENVEIVCAPFQELELTEKFDVVFCVGVLEYGSLFSSATDPYTDLLQRMRGLLSEGGTFVLAIENQFGLKYFSSTVEDHTGIPFDGIEGYPRYDKGARTFGLPELRGLLAEHYSEVDEYFPYPDYKVPQCVVSKQGLERIDCAELIGSFTEAPHDQGPRLFDPRLTLLQLERNQQLDFFSNSFLLVASNRQLRSVDMPALVTMFSTRRPPRTQTVTRVREPRPGDVVVTKELASGATSFQEGKLTLRAVEDPWVARLSLDTMLRLRVKRGGSDLSDIFAPCASWLASLEAAPEGEAFVAGDRVDCIWRNSYPLDGGCDFIDREWTWHEAVRRNALVLRSIYWFLEGIRGMTRVHPQLARGSSWARARRVAAAMGVTLEECDFEQFLEIEAEFCRVNSGIPQRRARTMLKFKAQLPRAYAAVTAARRVSKSVRSRLRRLQGLMSS